MPTLDSSTQRLRSLFRSRLCWTLAQLAEALDCAAITVRRVLGKTGYFRSFTHNGKWYTLPEVPEFNAEGIWHYQRIGFSKKGSLTKTILHLVDRSSSGLSAAQIGEKLQHPVHSLLSTFHKQRKLERVKAGGEFRYLSVKPRVNRRQRNRLAIEVQEPPATPANLSTRAALFVLVEHIKGPHLDFEQLAEQVNKERGLSIGAQSIRLFFEKEGLKKTPDPTQPRH